MTPTIPRLGNPRREGIAGRRALPTSLLEPGDRRIQDLEPSPHSGLMSRDLRGLAFCDQLGRPPGTLGGDIGPDQAGQITGTTSRAVKTPHTRKRPDMALLASTGGERPPGDGSRDFPAATQLPKGGACIRRGSRRRGTYNAHARICRPIGSGLRSARVATTPTGPSGLPSPGTSGVGYSIHQAGRNRTAGTEGPA